MLMGVLEKLSFGLALVILHAVDRVSAGVLAAGAIDLALGVCFVLAFVRSRDSAPAASVIKASQASSADSRRRFHGVAHPAPVLHFLAQPIETSGSWRRCQR